MKRSNLNVVGPPIKVFCGKTGSWCGFVATENCYAFSDASTRQINLLHILCLCKGSFVLASQDARPRSSHLFPLLSGNFKTEQPLPAVPRAVWPNTQKISSASRLSARPSLQSRSEQGHENLRETSQLTPSFALKYVIGSPSGVVLYERKLESIVDLSKDGSQLVP